MYNKISFVRKPLLIISILVLIFIVYPVRNLAARGEPYLTPDNISIVSGDGQSGGAGLPLPLPFAVKVLGQSGDPIISGEVTFTVLAGGGKVTRSVDTDPIGQNSVTVDTSNGIAKATLILGMLKGINRDLIILSTF